MAQSTVSDNDANFYTPMQPTRRVILAAIQGYLDRAYEWGEEPARRRINVAWTENVIKYIYRAEALIELLEVHDCGSAGGFDKDTGDPRHGLFSLEERLEALKRKYPAS